MKPHIKVSFKQGAARWVCIMGTTKRWGATPLDAYAALMAALIYPAKGEAPCKSSPCLS